MALTFKNIATKSTEFNFDLKSALAFEAKK